MMFEWKPDMIRFMRDACEYNSYNSELAQVVLPYINKDSHVCDAGCGLGYLSLELAKAAGRVTAVDINEDALDVLRDNCAMHSVNNIDIVCTDIFSMDPPEKYSAMVFCYFGDMEAILENMDRLCSGPVIIFKRNYDKHRFSAGSLPKAGEGFKDACKHLDKLGISYKAIELENEFGQPFKSMADARRFFELYGSLHGDGSCVNPESLHGDGSCVNLEKIIHTGREDFPLYLPVTKRTGCIIITRGRKR